ncbi:MAG: tetratricopeptide repeat protein [Nannocystaceae bacterium]
MIEGVYAAQMLGRHAAARARAEQVQAQAAALPWPPLEVEAAFAAGANRLRTGDVDGATAQLEDSFAAAYAHGLDGVAASIAAELAFALGVNGKRPDDAAAWLQRGRAALQRYGDDPVRLAALDNAEGTIHYVDGDYERAAAMFERTIASREAIGGPEHPDLATVRSNLGVAFTLLGRNERAEQEYRRAEAIAVAAFGPKHPEVASALANRGNLAHQRGDDDEALALHREALAIRIEIGAPTATLASSWVNIGAIERARGRFDEAERAGAGVGHARAGPRQGAPRRRGVPDEPRRRAVRARPPRRRRAQLGPRDRDRRGHLRSRSRAPGRAAARPRRGAAQPGPARAGPGTVRARAGDPHRDLRRRAPRGRARSHRDRRGPVGARSPGGGAGGGRARARDPCRFRGRARVRGPDTSSPRGCSRRSRAPPRAIRTAMHGAQAVAGFAQGGDRWRHADAAAWLAAWLTGGTAQADRYQPAARSL